MSPELDALLCDRYPAIFAERHLPMTQTAMCWGFSCGDGWFDLIDRLCADLQAAADAGHIPQPVAVQVKEKYGELRFYLRGQWNGATYRLIEIATERSLTICETCGAPGVLRETRHYFRTHCDTHASSGSVVVRDDPESAIGRDER